MKNIKDVIDNNELQLYYQSQYLFKDNILYLDGAEALIRWCHKDGLIEPNSFIDTLEENNDIHELGRFVAKKACETLQDWGHDEKLQHLHLAFNVSPLQLKDFDFLDYLKECIAEYSFDTKKLKIEITENTPIESSLSREILIEISKLGVSVALDDFGTKNSSLNVLLDYPISEIKIDKDFISSCNNPITKSSKTRQIVDSINDISKSVGCTVLAEGVESFCQLKVLLEIGISKFQGFYFSKPLPRKTFEEHIRKNGHTHDVDYLF
jgi:EAL domain-containing protein (putative c-di-GMP-specific phosphodiesterase class I)